MAWKRKKLEGTLPASGLAFVLHEMTGADELAALRNLLGHTETERNNLLVLEQIALCLELSGKRCTGHADILTLPSRDLQLLVMLHTRLNAIDEEGIKLVADFFGTSSSSPATAST
jgi:hypothetical protein